MGLRVSGFRVLRLRASGFRVVMRSRAARGGSHCTWVSYWPCELPSLRVEGSECELTLNLEA